MRGIQGGIASAIRAGRATVDYYRLARRARCPCVTLSRPARRLSSKPRASEQAAENTRVSMLYADLESRVAEKVKEITRYNSQRVRVSAAIGLSAVIVIGYLTRERVRGANLSRLKYFF